MCKEDRIDYHEIELDEAKSIMLNVLIEFDKICKKNHLTYWLAGGTLLGAVRHQGFIPWDDDIDLAMPRDDYEKLNSIEFPENLFLQNKRTDNHFRQYFTKIRDNDSLYIENGERNKNIDYHQGIFIDIFPINFISNSLFPCYPYLQRFCGRLVSKKRFYAKWTNIDLRLYAIKLLNSFHNKRNSILINGLDGINNRSNEKKKCDVFPLVEGVFEGHLFPIPKNYKSYLQVVYGENFMEFPPEDQRLVHRHKIYIKKK